MEPNSERILPPFAVKIKGKLPFFGINTFSYKNIVASFIFRVSAVVIEINGTTLLLDKNQVGG